MNEIGEPSGLPVGLQAAFDEYERALLDDDLGTLDAYFAPGDATMRGDAEGLLVGHAAISSFRTARGGVSRRRIVRVEHRVLGPDDVITFSVSRYDTGGMGLQTQHWTRRSGRWLIAAAHVTGRGAAFDRSIWRVVGDPLIAPDPAAARAGGPLADDSVAVKDLFAIDGFEIGAGNPTRLSGARRERITAAAVDDLLRAGAAVRGIARTDEFAFALGGENPHYGTAPNSALPGALPGGSSSGTAAAVALGHASVGLATDTAGSIRVPASYQGLWGLRTTWDSVSRAGLLPLAPSFDTVGWMTRDGTTMERVARVGLAASAVADSALPPQIAVPVEILEAADSATVAAFESWCRSLEERSLLRVSRVSIGDPDHYVAALRTVQGAEAWRAHGTWIDQHPGALGSAAASRFAAGAAVAPSAEKQARTQIARLRQRLRAIASDIVLIFPTVPGPAPSRHGSAGESVRTATLRITAPASVAGLPALSVPVLEVPTRHDRGPVGVTFLGPPGTEIELILFARRVAAASISQESV